jgi:hypothetical protein
MDGTRVSTPSRAGTDTSAATSATGHLGVGRQVWHFARHYLEMCAAMCIGGVLLNTLVFVVGPTLLGYPDLRKPYPGPARVLAAVLFTLPMAAWMRIRGMAWGPTLEMSGATVGLAIVVVALSGAGVVSASGLHAWLAASCGPWCVVMIVAMLFRLPLYTGRTGHQMGHRRHTTNAT